VELELFDPISDSLFDLSVNHVFGDRRAVTAREYHASKIADGDDRSAFLLGFDFVDDGPGTLC
jgi:hypothetical protein